MHMIAAHFIGLSEHDVHVLLPRELCVIQWLKDAAARVAMRLHGLHADLRAIWRIHAPDYSRGAAGVQRCHMMVTLGVQSDGRTAVRRVAHPRRTSYPTNRGRRRRSCPAPLPQ